MTALSDWLLVAGLVVGSALVLVRSELVRRRRGVSRERRQALVVFQTGSALFVVTMVAFENVFGLVSGLGVPPAVHVLVLLASLCCICYGYVRLRRSDGKTATGG